MLLFSDGKCFLKASLLIIFLGHAFLANATIDFLVFPEIKINHNNGESFSNDNITPSLDFFLSGNMGSIKLLSELYVSERVQHIERLQVGFNLTPSARLWFGRHHNPNGYWHTQYHHGTFLQTSITRPSMVELGGAGGIIPSHSTGVLLEGELELQTSAWHYAASIGLTSQLNFTSGGHHGGDSSSSLSDFDFSNPKPNNHELGYAFRLAYFPDALAENQLGWFINHEEITLKANQHQTSQTMHDEHTINTNEVITLDIIGIFANYQEKSWRFISEAYYFSSKVPTEMKVEKNGFSAAYLQIEYTFNDQLTPYMRLDRTFSHANDAYLRLLDGYSVNANTLGVRLDLPGHNAFKLEYSKQDFTDGDTEQWWLNWSAVW